MLIDLTMPLVEGMPSHPIHGRTPVFVSGTISHDRLYEQTARRNPYDGSRLSFQNATALLCDHTGTHMDAPLHVDVDGADVSSVPLEYGYGEAVWLDLSQHLADGGELTDADLADAEAEGGEAIQPGDVLLIWTGWSRILPDTTRYLEAHMGLTRSAAEWWSSPASVDTNRLRHFRLFGDSFVLGW